MEYNGLPQRDTLICVGENLEIGIPAVEDASYQWEPAVFLDDATASNPSALPDRTITYTLTATKDCYTRRDSVTIRVVPPDFGLDFEVNAPVFLQPPYAVGFTQTTADTENYIYIWDFGDGNQSDEIHPNHTYTESGTYTVKLIAQHRKAGCSDTLEKTVQVIHYTPPVVEAGPDTAMCWGKHVQLGTPPKSNLTYHWEPATGLSDANTAQPVATPNRTTSYTLTVTDTAGYAPYNVVRDTVEVEVKTLHLRMPRNTGIYCGDTIILEASTTDVDSVDWHWQPEAGLGQNQAAQTRAFPNTTTTYTLTARNQWCQSRDSVVVTVYPTRFSPDFDYEQDTLARDGLIVRFTNRTTDPERYSWLWQFGDGAYSRELHPVHSYLAADDYWVWLTAFDRATGCAGKTRQEIEVLAPPERLDNYALMVYPNPTDGELWVALGFPSKLEGTSTTLEVYDILLRRVYARELQLEATTALLQLQLPPMLSEGIYVLRVQLGTKQLDTKIRVVR